MNIATKAFLTATLLALPLPAGAWAGDRASKAETVIVADDDGDADVLPIDGYADGETPRPRAWRTHSGGYLGVSLIAITPELREHYGASKEAGVLVGRVEKDGPGAKAGIEVGDVIIRVGGERVDTPGEVSRAVREHRSGDVVKLELVRNRSAKTLSATLDARPVGDFDLGDFGALRELPGQIRRELRAHPWASETPDVRPFVAPREDVRRLRERLEDLEKRLKELEDRRGR